MKLDLKLVLVIVAVILLVGFLSAEPSSRRRSSSSSTRRRATTSSRRRTTYNSRRSSEITGSASTSKGVLITVVVVVLFAVLFIAIGCSIFIKRYRDLRGQEEFRLDPIFTEPYNFEVDAVAPLPYPLRDDDNVDACSFPDNKSSLAYPPQGETNPSIDVANSSAAYPPQFSSSADPPQGTGEELPGNVPGQAQEGFGASPPPIQFDSGENMPPPPSYDDMEAKKKT